MKTNLRPTIADVARAAGVSKSTVSRVLNNQKFHIAEETREKVLNAIDQLDYHPSSVARSLVSKRTQSVGLLISDVANPFYPEVIQGVEEVASRDGYQVFLSNTNYEAARGINFVRSLVDKQVDGVLLMTSSVNEDLISELTQHHIPMVVLDWDMKRKEGGIGIIEVDFESGISEAVQYLVGLGHQQLAHVSGPLHLRTSQIRRDTFLSAALQCGIKEEDLLVVEGDFQFQSGYAALPQLLSHHPRPTAVFASNDLMAVGLLSAAREHGCRIPDDLSLIGFDDVQLTTWVHPSLTTVALPRQEIGQRAMEMLFGLMNMDQEGTQPAIFQEVKTFLIVRNSCGIYQPNNETEA